MEESIQPLCTPMYPLDNQGELPGIDGPIGHRSVLFGLRIENTWLEFPEANSMPQPGDSARCNSRALAEAEWCRVGALEPRKPGRRPQV